MCFKYRFTNTTFRFNTILTIDDGNELCERMALKLIPDWVGDNKLLRCDVDIVFYNFTK